VDAAAGTTVMVIGTVWVWEELAYVRVLEERILTTVLVATVVVATV